MIYQLKVAGGPVEEPWSVRLWRDSRLKPINRTLTIRFRGVDTSVVETYGEFTLHSDIPEGKFRLPERK